MPASTFSRVLLAVVCVAVLTAAAPALVSAAPESSATTALPPFVSQLMATITEAVSPAVTAIASHLPPSLRQLAPPFLQGAVSVVMVGRGARLPPASVNGPTGDELLLHTTTKFIYAAGAIAAELTLLRLVYREPYRNLRRNPMNRFFCSPLGFALLVLLTAVPNDLVDTSLLAVFVWRLSAAVYTPAIVCGQLLRVYVAALVPRLPVLSAAYAVVLAYGGVTGAEAVPSSSSTLLREAGAEAALMVVVGAAVAFALAARRGAGVDGAKPREPESDGDDYYED